MIIFPNYYIHTSECKKLKGKEIYTQYPWKK